MTKDELRNRLNGGRLSGSKNQCPVCGELFGGLTGFDAHRVGSIGVDRRCLTAAEMPGAGLSLSADGFWRRAAPGFIQARQA